MKVVRVDKETAGVLIKENRKSLTPYSKLVKRSVMKEYGKKGKSK